MKNKLIEIGFTNNEAKIYESLVNNGELSASEISKKVSIDRSVTYHILDNLILKGFVSYIEKKGKRRFLVKNPDSLLISLNERLDIANNLVKQIKACSKKENNIIDISIYEGITSLKVLDSEWTKSEQIYALNVTGKAEEIIPYHMAQMRLGKNKLKEAKIIVSSDKAEGLVKNRENKKVLQENNVKIKVLPKRYWNEVPIVIHDDVVLITIFEDDKPHNIRIQNKKIAGALKKNFEYLWSLMK
ncbi:hypothetical protein CMI42_02695 [Candidatus Pacearchaeota archaeon]|nr:hypothetical protein [Candidatus Pacearchaeota archaeon]|tara:strand:+ start:220 stop:951 length:732 start_codon:yes stop_codon:yes gene_type:complete